MGFTAAMIELYCPECAQYEAFEQPSCVDGHGPDCPEWFCLSCGIALLIGVPIECGEPQPRTLSSRAA